MKKNRTFLRGANPKSPHKYRSLIFAIGVLESAIFSGLIFCWPQIVYILKTEGIYSNFCSNSTPPSENSYGAIPGSNTIIYNGTILSNSAYNFSSEEYQFTSITFMSHEESNNPLMNDGSQGCHYTAGGCNNASFSTEFRVIEDKWIARNCQKTYSEEVS